MTVGIGIGAERDTGVGGIDVAIICGFRDAGGGIFATGVGFGDSGVVIAGISGIGCAGAGDTGAVSNPTEMRIVTMTDVIFAMIVCSMFILVFFLTRAAPMSFALLMSLNLRGVFETLDRKWPRKFSTSFAILL